METRIVPVNGTIEKIIPVLGCRLKRLYEEEYVKTRSFSKTDPCLFCEKRYTTCKKTVVYFEEKR